MRRTLLVCLLILCPSFAVANDLCGMEIVASIKLDHDLVCPGNGLVIGADGIQVDLDGHAITGSGGGVGIDVVGRTNVAVVGGTVRNFAMGVRTLNSSQITIKKNLLLENGDGLDLAGGSAGVTVMDNEFRDNRTRGIMIRSNSQLHMIKDNTFAGDRVGILIFGGNDVVVHSNTVMASVLAAIRVNVIATRNLVMKNTVTTSPAGIEFLVTPTGSATGNTISKNTIALNVCGVKGPIGDNRMKQNVFEANGTDTCR
jgi:large repetitive protein